VAALSAGAATPSCGNHCIDVVSRAFGTHHQPNYVLDVLRQGAKVGQPVILFRTSNSDPAEDFTTSFQGLTSEFNAAGLVSNAVALHYGCAGQFAANSCTKGVDDPAFEVEYAPYGVDSGLCVGVAKTAFQNEGVTLQPCGISGRTVWILDPGDSPATINHDYVPVINGSDTNFSHPFVMTYPKNGHPTDTPGPELNTYQLQKYSNGTVFDNELWGANFGVLR
jgi:hypothetical protein